MRSTPIVVLMAYATHAFAQVSSTASTSQSPASTVSAGGSNLSLFLPIDNQFPIAASVISWAPSSTVYSLGCPATQGACAQCDFAEGLTVTAGPSTVIFTTGLPEAQSASSSSGALALSRVQATVNCALQGTTGAVCTEQSTRYGGSVDAQTVTLAASDISSLYAPVTLLANITQSTLFANSTQSTLPANSTSSTLSANSTQTTSPASITAPANNTGAIIAGAIGVTATSSGGPAEQTTSTGEATRHSLGVHAAVGVAFFALWWAAY